MFLGKTSKCFKLYWKGLLVFLPEAYGNVRKDPLCRSSRLEGGAGAAPRCTEVQAREALRVAAGMHGHLFAGITALINLLMNRDVKESPGKPSVRRGSEQLLGWA